LPPDIANAEPGHVCREFAERIGYNDPDKAYLAGVFHDLASSSIRSRSPINIVKL